MHTHKSEENNSLNSCIQSFWKKKEKKKETEQLDFCPKWKKKLSFNIVMVNSRTPPSSPPNALKHCTRDKSELKETKPQICKKTKTTPILMEWDAELLTHMYN